MRYAARDTGFLIEKQNQCALNSGDRNISVQGALSLNAESCAPDSAAFPFRSRSTRTNSPRLFRFLKAQVLVASVRCTPCVTCLRLGAWSEEAKRRVLLASCLSASLSLIISFPLIHSFTFLAFSASFSLSFARARSHPDPADHPDAVVETIRHNNGQT